jgi:hypothetical protein
MVLNDSFYVHRQKFIHQNIQIHLITYSQKNTLDIMIISFLKLLFNPIYRPFLLLCSYNLQLIYL